MAQTENSKPPLPLAADANLNAAIPAQFSDAAYAPPMPFETTVDVIARAHGFNGFCRDYLFDTLDGMRACGIRDQHMEKLARAVRERLASSE